MANVTSDADVRALLTQYKKYAVVGISANAERPSFRVTRFMQSKGYDTIGVNPGQSEILGRPCYPDLASAARAHPEHMKMINVFRSPETIPAVVDEILKLSPRPEVLWLQLGITHPEAEARAEAAGIKVVSNKCLHIEMEKLF